MKIKVEVLRDNGSVYSRDFVEVDEERYMAFLEELEGWGGSNFMAWVLEKLVYHGVRGFHADELKRMLDEARRDIHPNEE